MLKNNCCRWRVRAPHWLGPVLLLSVAMIFPVASAVQPEAIQAQAKKLFQASTRYLAGQARFSVDTQSSIEVVLESGQKIQFDHAVSLTVQRLNKLRAERLGDQDSSGYRGMGFGRLPAACRGGSARSPV